MTIAQLKDRIAKTIEYLKGMKASEIDGTEGKEIKITFPNGNTRDFTGQSLLLGNGLPNFYFHATTAYDILRQCGVEVGKRDFMGTPPAFAVSARRLCCSRTICQKPRRPGA